MLSTIARWLHIKWIPRVDAHTIDAYGVTFGTAQGRLVLQHLLDTVYCTIYEGTDPIALAAHNAQRALVQSILENIDKAQNPAKYAVFVEAQGAENGLAR